MKVVLLTNIRGIGHVSDIKEVNDGYARNFLFPRKAARPVTDGILKEVATTKAQKLQAATQSRDQAQALAKTLSGTRVELTGKASPKGKLFAAITQVTIDGRTFTLPEPIKTTGEHPVLLELTDGITASVTVVVTAER
jgi:large subunit ribosomal protein L9